MNYYDLISLILTQLHERINSDEFLERFRRPNSFVRYRKLTLKQVVAYLIHSKKRSMDIDEYSCAVTPQVRQTGNRLSGLAGTAYASLLA